MKKTRKRIRKSKKRQTVSAKRKNTGGMKSLFSNKCTDNDYYNGDYSIFRKNCCNWYNVRSKERRKRCLIDPQQYYNNIEDTKNTYKPEIIPMSEQMLYNENQSLKTKKELDSELKNFVDNFTRKMEMELDKDNIKLQKVKDILDEANESKNKYVDTSRSFEDPLEFYNFTSDFLLYLFKKFSALRQPNVNDPYNLNKALIYSDKIEMLKNHVDVADLLVSRGNKKFFNWTTNLLLLDAVLGMQYFLVWYIEKRFPKVFKEFLKRANPRELEYLKQMQPELDWLNQKKVQIMPK